jgi:hypothetical protein
VVLHPRRADLSAAGAPEVEVEVPQPPPSSTRSARDPAPPPKPPKEIEYASRITSSGAPRGSTIGSVTLVSPIWIPPAVIAAICVPEPS